MTDEIVEPELEILNHILVLRKKSCKTFSSCDLCPFSDDEGDTGYNDDEYRCKLEDSTRTLINNMFGRCE